MKNVQIKQQDTYIFLKKALKPYLNKGYAFSPDTNFFMECPEIFHFLKEKKEKVLISKVTYDELDSGKHVATDANELEKERAWKRRKGLEAMDKAEAIRVQTPSTSYIQGKKLGFSNDEKIIASYLKHAEDTKENVLFLTLDRGAKTIARSVALPIAEFDITEFFRLKNPPRVSPVKKTTTPVNNRNKRKRNPIVRLIQGIIRLIQRVVGLCIMGFIVLLVFALINAAIQDSERTKTFNHIVGDQSVVAVQVTDTGNDKGENEFSVKVELSNQTSKDLELKGYYIKGQLTTSSLEEGPFGVKIIYKDGSEEVQIGFESLQPREKKTLYVQSNGQLEDVEQIDIQYKEKGTKTYNVLTIDPQ